MSLLTWVKEAFEILRAHSELDILKQKDFRGRIDHIIERLGSDKLEVRLAGIHDFGQTASKSEDASKILVEILPAFVRRRAAERGGRTKSTKRLAIPEDVQLSLTILGRQNWAEKWEHGIHLDLSKTQLIGANLHEANLFSPNFLEANLCNADFTEASCPGANFNATNLKNATFDHAYLFESRFMSANLRGANLNMAMLRNACFGMANLTEASLWQADLKNADISCANLHEAHLSEACLENASLIKSNLTNSGLAQSNLRGARLAGADLRRAYFQGARLDGANLMGTNLLDTVCLTSDQLCACMSLYDAKMKKALRDSVRRAAPTLLGSESAGQKLTVLEQSVKAKIDYALRNKGR